MKRLLPVAVAAVLLLAGCSGTPADPADAAFESCKNGVTPQLPNPDAAVWPDDYTSKRTSTGYVIVADVKGEDDNGEKVVDHVTCTVTIVGGGFQLEWSLTQEQD